MNKQPEITDQTRRNLIDACFELIKAGQKATVGDIAKKAGYNRCTFYRYFSDVRQLLDQIEDEICGELDTALRVGAGDLSGTAISSLASVYTKYGKVLSVLLGPHGDPIFREKMRTVAEPIFRNMLNLSTKSDVETELKTEFGLSAVLGTVTKWYQLNMPISTEELAELITGTICSGLRI